MDKDTLIAQMKVLKAKSKAARKQGNRTVALRFRAGARRLRRRIKGLEPKQAQKKASED